MKQVQKTFDDLENRTVYIVGLGEMGSLMLKYVQENTTKIFASSKTFANAEKFADVLTPVKFEDRYEVLGKCDVVILCSACQEPIVTKDEFVKALALYHPVYREDNSEGERCKNEKDHFYNRAEELGLRAAPSSKVLNVMPAIARASPIKEEKCLKN